MSFVKYMEKTSFISTILLSLFLISSCTNNYSSNIDSNYEKGRVNFYYNYNKSGLFDHFPRKIDHKRAANLYLSPPSIRKKAKTGLAYLVYNDQFLDSLLLLRIKSENTKRFNYKTDNIFTLSINNLKDSTTRNSAYNIYIENKLPVPYFEEFDFQMNSNSAQSSSTTTSSNRMPADLLVYVLEANNNNYWKDDYYEFRSESLKNWKNGYSKGIAISKKDNLLVFWVMIW